MNSDTKILSIIGIITVAVIVVGLVLANGSQQKASQGSEITVNKDVLVREDSLRQTGKDPKIQFVEFADFECPACAMLHPALKKIMQEYGDKIDFVFRVIPIHQHSILAASAVFAAREQGKFIEMHDIVYENQDKWTAYGLKDAEISTLFVSYAQQIGLDVAKYKADLEANSTTYAKIVYQDQIDANSMGINSTPTAIINGKALIRGVVTYDKLKAIIEAELNPKSATTEVKVGSSTKSITTSVQVSGQVSDGGQLEARPVQVTPTKK